MADLATLSIKVDASGAVQVLDQLGNKLGQTSSKAETLSATVGKLAAVFAGFQAAKFAQDTLNLGARYETLGVVMDVLGRNAGKTRAEMDGFQASLQKTGISMIGARESLARMAGAQLDMAKSSELARVAQNAAVIANVNSSEAFDTLINGITTGQPRILRTLGIFVDMEAGQRKYARSIGKSAEELTSAEKTQANMNTAMQGGVAIAGSYEAAMGTAGKQLLSTVRYMEDARVKASAAFQPAYTQAVFAYANALKWAGDNASTVTGIMAGLATAIGLVVAAVAALKLATLALALTPLGAALTAGLGVAALLVGSYVKSVAEARQATEAWSASIKELSEHSLRGLVASTQAQIDALRTQNVLLAGIGHAPDIIAPGAAAKIAELETRLKAYTDALKAHGVIAKAAAEAENVALQKFNDEKKKGLANAQMEREWKLAHLKLLENEAVADLKVAAATDEITFAAKRRFQAEKDIADIRAGKYPDRPGILDSGGKMFLKFTSGEGGLGNHDMYVKEKQLIEQNRDANLKAIETVGIARSAAAEAYIKQLVGIAPIVTESEKEQAKIREQFMKQLQQTFANGIANMLENGLSSWRSFFDSLKSMFIKLVADFAAAKIMDKILGTGQNAAGATSLGAMFGGDFGKGGGGTAMAGASVALTAGMIGYGVGGMTRNTTTGALAGGAAGAASGAAMGALLGPIGAGAGALIGGLAGLVTGFMGASAAAKKYAEDMVKQQNSLLAAAQAFVDRGLTGQAKIESEQNKLAKERDDLLKGLAANFKAGGFGKDGAANYQHTVEEIGFAYDRQKKALEATTKAAEDYSLVLKVVAEFEETNFVRSLRARELRAAGATEEADALDLFNRQVVEFADAVKKGYDETTLARLAYVQSLEVERTAYQTNLSAQITAANATRMSALTDETAAVALRTIDSQRAIGMLQRDLVPLAERELSTMRLHVDALEADTKSLLQQANAFDSARASIESFSASLDVGTYSPLSPEDQLASAKAALAGAAASGSADTAQYARTVLDASRAYNASGAAYMADYAAVKQYLAQGASVAANAAAAARQSAQQNQTMIDLGKTQIDTLKAILAAVASGVAPEKSPYLIEMITKIFGGMTATVTRGLFGGAFASGGITRGGLSLVGENGPELINTGPARIFSASDTAAAFAGNGTATVEELRRVIARLETLVRVTASGAQETVKAVARVSNDVANLTREVRLSSEAAA